MSTASNTVISKVKNRTHKIFGGIRPIAYKESSLRSRIMPSPIPDQLILSLRQHQGELPTPIVKVGDTVLKYQLIAEAKSPGAVNLHAPTSGKVIAIESHAIPHELHHSAECIILATDKNDTCIDPEECPDYRAMSQEDLIQRIHHAGICGLGGAGYSSSTKLSNAKQKNIGLLIINAAECEPFITADEALAREFATEIISGAEILQKASAAPRAVIAIEKNKVDAIAALKSALIDSQLELIALPEKYPVGGEKQIVQGVTGLEVPTGSLPIDIGVLVHNVGTAFAVHKAIVYGEPCISRITTLTGAPLQTPKNFEALVGTSADYLFEICGINNEALTGAIVGGSLMGNNLTSLSSPVLKTTNCLVAKSLEEFPVSEAEKACIRCGYCADACPAKLLPQQLYAFSRSENREQLESHGLFDCIECGACAYVCPSDIPLVHYYRASKQELREQINAEEQSEHWQSRYQIHQYRLRKNKEDKLSKRTSQKNRKSASEKTATAEFSREKAKEDIAAAVARVKARKKNVIASTTKNDSTE